MKKNYYLYADFETTQIELPEKYESFKEFYKAEPDKVKPQIYSWSVLYDKKYKKMGEHNYTTPDKEKYKYHYDISGESFIDFLENLTLDTIIYFNNLKGFDGHFLIPLLDAAGYVNVLDYDIEEITKLDPKIKDIQVQRALRIKEELMLNPPITERFYEIKEESGIKKANIYIAKQVKKRWKKLLPNEYSLMVNGANQIFQIKIGLKSTKTTNGIKQNRAVIIKDNLLLFPTSIKKMGETLIHYYANKYKLLEKDFKTVKKYHDKRYNSLVNKYAKIELSTGYTRTELYKDIDELKNDGNELEYLIKDTFILFEFHNVIEKYFPRKDWRLTIASTSYKNWNNKIGIEIAEELVSQGKVKVIKLERGLKKYVYNNKQYTTTKFYALIRNKIIPTMWLDDSYKPLKKNEKHKKYISNHNFLYNWYIAGRVKVNEEKRGKLLKNVTILDRNSSYPADMNSNDFIPIGKGIRGNQKGFPFKFYTLIPKVAITNEKGLPFLHNHLSSKREYLKTLLPNTEYKFTSISYKRFKKYYKCKRSDYKLITEYSFKQIPAKKIFGSYIDYWSKIKSDAKETGNKVLEFISKLNQNSLYGKFGTKNIRSSMIWNQEDKEWEKYSQYTKSKYYLPFAIAIGEMGGMSLVDAVGENYDKFNYCDTDSIFVSDFKKEDYKHLELHKSKLGAWDIEYTGLNGIVRRPKQYLFFKKEKNKTIRKIAYSGINFNSVQLTDKDLDDQKKELNNWKQITLLDYVFGKEITNQKNPLRINGSGIIITDIVKSITPIWSFKSNEVLSEQKYYKLEHFQETIKQIKELENEKISSKT